MKSTILYVGALLLIGTLGCQRGTQNSVRGESGEELTVSVPETVPVTQGQSNKFSVTITRKRINDTAKIKIDGLPKGVHVADGKFEFGDGINHQFVTLDADANAEAKKEVLATVTASAGKYTATANFKLQVVQSLENKAADKKAFAAEMEARLTKAKSILEDAENRVKASKDEDKRALLLKQISDRYESLADARGYYEKMLATPVEVWDRERQEVTSAVANIEKSAQSLHAELKVLKD